MQTTYIAVRFKLYSSSSRKTEIRSFILCNTTELPGLTAQYILITTLLINNECVCIFCPVGVVAWLFSLQVQLHSLLHQLPQ